VAVGTHLPAAANSTNRLWEVVSCFDARTFYTKRSTPTSRT
jgi:hypothetical protein